MKISKYIINDTTLFLCILLVPFFDFINTNYKEIDQVVYFQLIIYLITILFLIITIAKIINLILFNKIKFKLILIFIAFGFFISFKFFPIQNFLLNYSDQIHHSDIALLVIFIILILFGIILFLKNKIFYKFINYYFFLILILNLSFFFKDSFSDKFRLDNQNKLYQNKYFNDEEINLINKKNNNKNIYYIILDAAASLEKYSYNFNKNLYELEKKIKDSNLVYVPNTYSINDVSPHSLTSMMNLESILKINEDTEINYVNLFPNIISKSHFVRKTKPPLIKILNQINYKFFWIGNHFADCKFYNPDLCIYNDISQNFFETNHYVLDAFFANTPFKLIYKKLFSNIIINLWFLESPIDLGVGLNQDYGDIYYENDAIKKFIDNYEFDKFNNFNSFFLIHQMMPHIPFIYNSNCSKREEFWDQNLAHPKNFYNDFLVGYEKNYECMLIKIHTFMEFIMKNDPNAIIIFQGDHSWYFSDETAKEYANNTLDNNYKKYNENNLEDVFNIFTAVKINEDCKKYLNKDLNNVNAIRLSLSCAVNEKYKPIKNISFYSSTLENEKNKIYEYK